PSRRESAIEEMVRHSLELAAIERRWQEFQRENASLRWPTSLLFVYLFVLATILIWNVVLAQTWLGLLLGMLSLPITLSLGFFRRASSGSIDLELLPRSLE